MAVAPKNPAIPPRTRSDIAPTTITPPTEKTKGDGGGEGPADPSLAGPARLLGRGLDKESARSRSEEGAKDTYRRRIPAAGEHHLDAVETVGNPAQQRHHLVAVEARGRGGGIGAFGALGGPMTHRLRELAATKKKRRGPYEPQVHRHATPRSAPGRAGHEPQCSCGGRRSASELAPDSPKEKPGYSRHRRGRRRRGGTQGHPQRGRREPGTIVNTRSEPAATKKRHTTRQACPLLLQCPHFNPEPERH